MTDNHNLYQLVYTSYDDPYCHNWDETVIMTHDPDLALEKLSKIECKRNYTDYVKVDGKWDEGYNPRIFVMRYDGTQYIKENTIYLNSDFIGIYDSFLGIYGIDSDTVKNNILDFLNNDSLLEMKFSLNFNASVLKEGKVVNLSKQLPIVITKIPNPKTYKETATARCDHGKNFYIEAKIRLGNKILSTYRTFLGFLKLEEVWEDMLHTFDGTTELIDELQKLPIETKCCQ